MWENNLRKEVSFDKVGGKMGSDYNGQLKYRPLILLYSDY